MKRATTVEYVSRYSSLTKYIYVSLHTKFAAVVHLKKRKFLRAAENWVKFLILQEGTPRLML
jgi:hypothetical protein